MKVVVLPLIMAVVFVACQSEPKVEVSSNVQESAESIDTLTEPVFDSIKAAAYGADDYGMKQYVMAFLKSGPNRDRDSAEAYDLQMAHLENIGKMADEGKLVLAGPFMSDGDLRGIYIFNVTTIEEAQALTETDPAIQAGSLIMELVPWYGSAALMGVNSEHKIIARKNI